MADPTTDPRSEPSQASINNRSECDEPARSALGPQHTWAAYECHGSVPQSGKLSPMDETEIGRLLRILSAR